MICRDNAATIGRTLEGIAAVKSRIEIVALDNGSTDGTLALLEAHGARVIRGEWRGYVATKQAALDACEGDWAFCIDSDESLEPALAAAIVEAIASPRASGYRVNRKVWYAGAFLEHAWQPEWRLRLVRRGAARWGGIDPHDKLELVSGVALDLARSAVLRHDCMESAAAFLRRQVAHSDLFAAGLYASGKRTSPARLVLSPLGAFAKQVVLKSAWRDGWRGLVAAGCHGAAGFMKHAMLLERQRQEKGS